MTAGIFNRTELLLGSEVMERIRSKRVIIFGIGGVGSWCAECLVREGIRYLTLVDSDVVCVTNCNRQLMATAKTIGEPKVEALRQRLLEINPEADILALQKNYSEETKDEFNIETYDYHRCHRLVKRQDKPYHASDQQTLSRCHPCRERRRHKRERYSLLSLQGRGRGMACPLLFHGRRPSH